MKILTIFVLIFISNQLWAHTISGVVYNSENEVLYLANIVLLDKESDLFIEGVTTEKNGVFELHLPDNKKKVFDYKLKVSYIGFVTQEIALDTIKDTNNIKIILLPNENILKEVTITAYKNPFQIKGSRVTADVENTLLSKSGRLEDLMNKIPFVTGSGTTYEVFGRGQALIYLNGRIVRDRDILQNILSDDIKKIDVITNPGPKYDSSIRSVIHIYTKLKKGEGLGGSAYTYLQQGRRFTDNEKVSLLYRKNKLEWTGSLSYNGTRMKVYSEENMQLLTKMFSNTTSDVGIDYNTNYLMGSIGLNYSKRDQMNIGVSSQFSGGDFFNDVNISGLKHYQQDNLVFNEPQAVANSTDKPKKWLTNLYYSDKFGNMTLSISNDILLGNRVNLYKYTEKENAASVSTNGKMNYFMNSLITDLSTSISDGKLSYGVEVTYSSDKQQFNFKEDNVKTSMVQNSNKRKQLLFAGYIEFDKSWNIFNLNGGVRYERIKFDYYLNEIKNGEQEKKYGNFCPTINISLAPRKNIHFSLGYRLTVKNPSYGMLNDNIQYNGRYYYVQGNSLLEAQKTHSINALASIHKFKFIASYDIIQKAFTNIKNQYKAGEDIILSRTMNIPQYEVISLGTSWSERFGIYTPTIDLNMGQQFFSYKYMNDQMTYNKPYYVLKTTHSLRLPKGFNIDASVVYKSKQQYLFIENDSQWNSSIRVAKSFSNGFFIQLGMNNLFATQRIKKIATVNDVKEIIISDNDIKNISLLVSYNFNTTRNKFVNKLKSDEIKRY